MKRGSCIAGTAASKKVKACPDTREIEVVAKALRDANQLPSNVAELICATLSDILVPHSDERHAYQQKMVELVSAELAKIEASMQVNIQEANEAMGNAEEEKVARSNDLASFEATLLSAQTAYAAHKTALADITVSFNVAKAASEDAQKEEERARAEIDGAGLKKEIVQGLLTGLDGLHSEPAKIDGVIKEIVKNVNIEPAMLIAVPSALSKDAASRQGFDQMVMTQLWDKMTARIDELSRIVEESGPRMQNLCEVCSAATAALNAARRKLVNAAKDFTAAQTAQSEAEASMKNAQKLSRSAASKFAASRRTLEAAHAQLDLFRDGAMASFDKLRLREKPAMTPLDDDDKATVSDSPMLKGASVGNTPAEKCADVAEPAITLEALAVAGA